MDVKKIKTLIKKLQTEQQEIEKNKPYNDLLRKASYGTSLEQGEADYLLKCELRLGFIKDILLLLDVFTS